MDWTYDNRGKIAFIQDMANLAAESYRAGDFAAVEEHLAQLPEFIVTFLREANQRKQ